MNLLSVRNLAVRLDGRPVLHDVSLDIGAGDFIGLIGPNGAGKSTLLRAALGLVPAQGEIAFGGRDARRLSARERALRVAYLPQEREIAWAMTVEKLIWLGRSPHRSALQAMTKADYEAVAAAIGATAIEDLLARPSTALSGGEKARVLMARALAQDAPLLLADEPTAGLDPAHQIALMHSLGGLAREGRGIVVCLHDLGLAARWCTRLVLLSGGRIVAEGSPRAVLTPESMRAVYEVETYFAEHAGGPIVQPYDLTGRGDG